jgi:thiol-disulfide isomerase/thioredoxin
MKKLLLLLGAVMMIAACQQTPTNQVKLTGTILNPDTSLVLFAYLDPGRDTININEDGSFVYEKETGKPVTIMLVYGRNILADVFLSPGRSVDFRVDAADRKNSRSYSGDLAGENSYLLEKAEFTSDWQKNFRTIITKEPSEFKSSRDSVQDVYNELLGSYEGLMDEFIELEKIALQFGYFNDMYSYERNHKNYAKKESVDLPDGWYDFKSSIDLNKPELLEVPNAVRYMSTIINDGAMEEGGLSGNVWGTPEFLNAKISFINDNFSDPEIKESFLFDNISQQLDAGPPTGVEDAINNYLNTSANEENKVVIKEKMDAWSAILPGQPAPAFSLPDIDGKELALVDLAGKYVYIDFWATWCGPCRAEFPHYRQLVQDYKGRNVVFMSISVDKDKEAWKKMVEEEAFDWVQLHDSIMMNDDYLVRYIPTFVFVDTEGKIIDPRAPRPSDPLLREMLDAQPGL